MRVIEADVAPDSPRRSSGSGGARSGRARAVEVRRADEELDQGEELSGLRGRHRGRPPAARAPHRRHAGLRLAVGGEHRRRRRASRRAACGSSIRSTARAASSPATPIGRSRRPWSRMGGRCGGAVRAGDRRTVPRRSKARARRATEPRSRRARASASTVRVVAGPQRRLERLAAAVPGITMRAENPLACLANCAGRGGDDRRRPGWSEQPRLGPCGGRPFGARSRRCIDRSGWPAAALQSARSGARGADRGRRGPPCGHAGAGARSRG